MTGRRRVLVAGVAAAGVLAVAAPAHAGIAGTGHAIIASCSGEGPWLPTADFLLVGWGPPVNPAGSLLSGVLTVNGRSQEWVSDLVGSWPEPGVGWNEVSAVALPGWLDTLTVDGVSAAITC